MLNDSVGTRMNDFRTKRLLRIEARRTPVPIGEGAVAVAHILPVSSFNTSQHVQLNATRELIRPLHLLSDGRPSAWTVNVDGAVGFENHDAGNE